MNASSLTDAQILVEAGDGKSFPLKAYKALAFGEEIVRLRAENARLREALTQIEFMCVRQQRAAEEYRLEVGLPYLQMALDSARAALATVTKERDEARTAEGSL